MINKQTIISAYDEKLTLVQWLKLVNKALDEAVLTNVEIAQRGNATFVFVFTFEDGTQVESNEIIVNQGESIVGASIEDGHLLLTLSNDDVLDAGNVKPVSSFSINNSQHLIVHYADGTTQDLGAIFNGNININGNIDVSGNGTINSLKINGFLGSKDASYEYTHEISPLTTAYVKTAVPFNIARHSNGKFNLVLCLSFEILQDFNFSTTAEITLPTIAYNNVPQAIMDRLFILGGTEYTTNALLDAKDLSIFRIDDGSGKEQTFKVALRIIKRAENIIVIYPSVSLTSNYGFSFTQGQQFAVRFEDNFVL